MSIYDYDPDSGGVRPALVMDQIRAKQPDPFEGIPDSDKEFEGTELETPAERDRRTHNPRDLRTWSAESLLVAVRAAGELWASTDCADPYDVLSSVQRGLLDDAAACYLTAQGSEHYDATVTVPAAVAGMPGSSTPVADMLAGVDHAQNGPSGFGLGMAHELAALRDLAEAVRADLIQRHTMAPPVAGVTTHMGYTVFAVIPGDGPEWFVAGEDYRGHWVTWHAFTALPGSLTPGKLVYENGHYFADGDKRRRALASLAERAGIVNAPPF